jgi:Ca2+-binding RTX toxin-like protein
MAIYTFSALSDGQSIAFNPAEDDLVFDQTAISAADLKVVAEGSGTRIEVIAGAQAGKDILLQNTTPLQLATSNISFANGSALLFGDNAVAQNDNADNALFGTVGNDLIGGFGGNDNVQAGGGDDVLDGGAGNDTMSGNAGNDWVDGGTGNDNLTGGSGQDSFVLSASGAANADLLSDFASGWDDLRLDAAAFAEIGEAGRFAAGDERFHAAAGATSGAEADDRIIYNTTTRQLFYDADGSGAGASELIATLGSERTITASDIWVFGSGGGDPGGDGVHLVGTSGDDSLIGGQDNDTLEGLAGNDTLDGAGGNDTLLGGDDFDMFQFAAGSGDYGDDVVDGGAGDFDTLILGEYSAAVVDFAAGTVEGGGTGGAGSASFVNIERAVGGAFDDLLIAGDTGVRLLGADGGDTLLGGAGGDELAGDRQFFFGEFTGNDSIAGGGGDDDIDGGDGDDTLEGGAGNDTFFFDTLDFDATGEYGNDAVDGGAGTDTLRLQASSAAVIDLAAGMMSGGGEGGGGTASLASIENVAFNSDFGIRVIGDAGANRIENLAGGSDDTLDGGAGNDTLSGGEGADDYLFTQAPGAGNADLIGGFQSGEDQLVLSGDAMPALGAGGNFSANDARFFAGGGVNSGQDASDRIVYNTTTGQLWYDADGSGAGAAQLLAMLEDAPTLVASDIAVIGATEPPPEGIVGTEGNDILTGTGGDDTIHGLGGNDAIQAQGGNDTVFGGAGNDVFSGNAGMDWVQGGAGNDTVSGGGGQDSFAFADFGAGNADTLNDFASGWDSLHFDADAFTALGAEGQFASGDGRFHSAAGATSGHDADDRLVYNTTTRQLFYDADGSGSGASQLVATLQVGATLVATDVNVFNGGGGDPGGDMHLVGTSGDDSLVGGGGNDTLEGLAGNDTLRGLEGNDVLDGGEGTDLLDGGPGDDTYIGAGYASSADTVLDAGGIDTAIAINTTVAQLEDGRENLIYRASSPAEDVVEGNAADNHIVLETGSGLIFVSGGAGDDTLIGGDASDHFSFAAGHGNDTVNGGGGLQDAIQLQNAGQIDFRAGTASATGLAVSFADIETGIGSTEDDTLVADDTGRELYGRAGDDTLTGGAGDDRLEGDGWFPPTGWGDDVLAGGAGDDTLIGGAGGDTLNGGLGNDLLVAHGDGDEGADSFIFDVAPGAGNADSVEGFRTGEDTIVLDADAYGNVGAGGDFAAGDARFFAGAGANSGQDASDRVVYNTTTGQLWYDGDGSGGGAAQLIATLEDAPTLAATDISVLGATEPPPGGIVGTEGDDTITGTGGDDTISGLGGNDAIQGQAGNDTILGGAGNDVFSGNGGMDWLEGGAGNDTVTGGSGQDSFVFREAGAANADVVSEFASNWDGLVLDGDAFANLGDTGGFSGGDERFHAAAGATSGADAADRVVYDTFSGQLYYDADGSGAGGAQLITTLQGSSTLAATDITVI